MMSSNEEGLGNMKRKSDPPGGEDDEVKKKKMYDTTFSEISLKVLLRNQESITNGLENFLNMANAHSNGSESTDIISKYLASSPDCSEMLGLLDITQGKLSTGQVCLVYECLTLILTQIQSEPKHKSTGDIILQKLLYSHLGQMYNYLRVQNKSKTVKAALHLLIALTMLGDRAKRTVQSKFNFDLDLFKTLFQRRDRNDTEDVRSCLVLFTMSFIVEGDNELIDSIVQQKGFIQMTIAGLMHDPKEVVLDVITTLLDKVLKNPGISKTAKIRLFSEKVLKQLCELYEWQGPKGWRPHKDKRQSGEMAKEYMKTEEFLLERAQVVDVVHEFLLAICCSQKSGIVFFDRTFGTGQRNSNQLLTHLLQSISSNLEHPMKYSLAVSVLTASPDQLVHFLPAWISCMAPKWSDQWLTNMNFLVEVYKSLKKVPSFLLDTDSVVKDVNNVISMMTTYFLPGLKTSALLASGLRNEDLRVRHHCMLLVQVIIENCRTALHHIRVSGFGHDVPVSDTLYSIFTSLIVKALPLPGTVFGGVEKILDILTSPKKLEAIGVEVDLVEHVMTVLRVVKLYQTVCPSLLSDRPKDVVTLVEAVTRLHLIAEQDEQHEGKVRSSSSGLPQLDLLELLSEADAKTLSLGREGLLEKLLRLAHQCSKEKYKEKTISLVCKMLTSLDILSCHARELHLMIGVALTYEYCALPFSPIAFLSTCFCSLINNPVSSIDRTMEVQDDRFVMPNMDKSSSLTLGRRMKDAEIQEILNMPDKDLVLNVGNKTSESTHQTMNELPFSPLICMALEQLHYCKTDKESASEYVSAILVKIVHTLHNPRPLGVLVTSSKEALNDGVIEYFEYWAGLKKKKTKTPPLVELKMITPFSCHLLNWYMRGEESCLQAKMTDLEDIPSEERLVCLNQAVFYYQNCLSSSYTLGHKMKRMKVLRKAIVELFTSLVKVSAQMDNQNAEDLNMDIETKDDPLRKVPGVVVDQNDATIISSQAVTCILNNPTIKALFLSLFTSDKSSPSKSEDNEKTTVSASRLVFDVLDKCRNLKVSTSCLNILQDYLDKALDHLLCKTDDADTCLSFIQVTACHFDLCNIHKILCCFLKLSTASFFADQEDDMEASQIDKGQRDLPLTTIGKTFMEVFDCWTKLLNAYSISEDYGNPVLLSLSLKSKPEGVNVVNCERHHHHKVASLSLDISAIQFLFNLPLTCSNFDSALCDISRQFSPLTICCGQKTFKHLISQYLSLGREKQTMVVKMVAAHDSFKEQTGAYLQKHVKEIIKKGHFDLLKAFLEKQGSSKIIKVIGQRMLECCEDLLSSGKDSFWSCMEVLVKALSTSDDVGFRKNLFSAVQSYVTAQPSSVSSNHLSLMKNVFHALQSCEKHLQGSNIQPEWQYLEAVLKHLMFLLSKKSTRDPALEQSLIQNALDCLKCGTSLSPGFVASSWLTLVKNSLKHLYSDTALLKMLSELTPIVYPSEGNTGENGLPPKMMFEMCVSHTAFLPTLLSTDEIPNKDALVNLLYSLFQLESTCMKTELVSPFLCAYKPTLLLTNQQLLKMMQPHLQEMENNDNFPVLWGKSYLDHCANTKALGPSLNTEISMKTVLAELDTSQMHNSILHFAMERNTSVLNVCAVSEMQSLSQCYDQSYLLRVFQQLLSPAKLVPVRQFVAKECIGFLIMCLTSHHRHCRLLAYHCLNQFYQHLESSRCPEKNEFAFIFDLLNASRVRKAQRLSSVVALFLTRAIKLILDPTDVLYLPVIRFLLLKPEMDLLSVPEFYNLFFSSGRHYVRERNWIISLLHDGIRDESDYWMYQKRQIFRLLMSYFSSTMSDKFSQTLVLNVIGKACKQKPAVCDLISEHGLLPWLSDAITSLQKKPEHLESLCTVVKTIVATLGLSNHLDFIDTSSFKTLKSGHLSLETANLESFGLRDKDEELTTDKGFDPECHGMPATTFATLNVLINSLNCHLSRPTASNVDVDAYLNHSMAVLDEY